MKKIVVIIAAVVLIFLGIFFVLNTNNGPKDEQLVEKTLLVSKFTIDGTEMGKVLLQALFLRDLENPESISIAVDTNKDGEFLEDENLITEFPAPNNND